VCVCLFPRHMPLGSIAQPKPALWFPASYATLLFSSMASVHGPPDGPFRDWAEHACRCEKGVSGLGCHFSFSSVPLFSSCFSAFLFAREVLLFSPRCCFLLFVPLVVTHVHL
jgi:hypothetical protein